MSAFVDTSKLAITDGDNTIFVKRRMDFGTKCLVEDTLTRMALKDGAVDEIQLTLGAQKLALALHNIVGWEGPDFAGTPCTHENIRRLDDAYPLFVKAQNEITRLNTRRPEDTPDPKATTVGADG